MTAILSQTRHAKYVQAFHKKVKDSPKRVLVKYIEEPRTESSDYSFSDFTGITEPAPNLFKEVEIPCLYNKVTADYDKSYVGYNSILEGKIYFSPALLVKAFGTYDLDPRRVEIVIDGITCIINRFSKKEELYNTCVAVEMVITDKLRA